MSVLEGVVLVAAVGVVLARWAPTRTRRPLTLAAVVLAGPAAVALVVLELRWQWVPVLAGGVLALPAPPAGSARSRPLGAGPGRAPPRPRRPASA